MVKHMMIEDVVTAKSNVTAKDAARTMQEKHVGSIVIADNSQKCIGIFTERDAIRIMASDISLNTPIEQVMSKNVITIGKEASLEEVRRLTTSHGIRHLPVVDSKGRLVGLISVRKLIDELYGWIDATSKYG
jgi:CBS domain-containing protein